MIALAITILSLTACHSDDEPYRCYVRYNTSSSDKTLVPQLNYDIIYTDSIICQDSTYLEEMKIIFCDCEENA